jgi:hypothetical protein
MKMADDRIESVRQLDRLVRSHGGVLGAIEAGVRSGTIDDPEIASAWRRVEQQYAEMRPNVVVVGRVLRASRRV